MVKSVTIKLEDSILQEARHLAVDEHSSFTGWVAKLVTNEVEQKRGYSQIAEEAITSMDNARESNWRFDRDDLYSDRSIS